MSVTGYAYAFHVTFMKEYASGIIESLGEYRNLSDRPNLILFPLPETNGHTLNCC
ncbi:hypothetical protein [Nostoc sp.]|uniref:hypothetical protein n=1 Tax=Nostoc sp. TaxID=1180 RepID=UPI002FF447F2